MELQNAFYIIAIIYMAFMFVVTWVVIIAALVVRSKIARVQRVARARARAAKDVSEAVLGFFRAARYIFRG
jgi:hypothetical protein